MLKPTLFKKFFPNLLVLSLAGFFALLVLGRYHFKNFYYEEKTLHLKNIANAISDSVKGRIANNQSELLQQFVTAKSKENSQRITVINQEGQVLADSNKDPALLDNHKRRPEVELAHAGKIGISLRFSSTLNQESLYVAIPLVSDGKIVGVLRTSYTTQDFKPILWGYTWKVFWGSVILGLLMTALLALNFRKLSTSLDRIQEKAKDFALGNFNQPIPVNPDDTYEIGSLVKSLNQMALKLGQLFDEIERQRNERQAIFNGMSEGVLSIYMDGGIFHWNEVVCNLFEVPYHVDYKGIPLTEVFKNNQVSNFAELVKKQHFFIEDEIELASGKVLQVHGSLLKEVQGDSLGVLMVFNDISRIRKLEGHRKDFVSNVSHELRTPLTSIQSYVETLLEGNVEDPSTRDRFLLTIKRNTEKLHQITEDLLALSELDLEKEDGKVTFELTELGPIVKGAIKNCEPKARCKEIELEMVSQKDVFNPVNSRLIEQALINLIDNAIKYSSEKTQVTITLAKDKEEKNILIQVADQGPGIDKDHLERLFERYYSAENSQNKELDRPGLGLSIVKNIALAHGGRVNVESVQGKGSLFTIILPNLGKS